MSEKKNNDMFTVEKVLNMRKTCSKNEYLVKWAGYPDSENTWEPFKNISTCIELVDSFLSTVPRKIINWIQDSNEYDMLMRNKSIKRFNVDYVKETFPSLVIEYYQENLIFINDYKKVNFKRNNIKDMRINKRRPDRICGMSYDTKGNVLFLVQYGIEYGTIYACLVGDMYPDIVLKYYDSIVSTSL